MPLWQQVLWIVFGVVLVIYLWPRARYELERSKQVEKTDWAGALLPVSIVVLFVILLIVFVRS